MNDKEDLYASLNTHNWIPENDKTGILLIDIQEYFREICRPVLDNLIGLITAARILNIPLFLTQHGHGSLEEAGMLGEWWADLIIEGSEEARLLPELSVGPDDIIIPKNRYSAFFRTELEKALRERKITDLVIGGVMTNLCCETTARDAFVRDFRVFFLADGTGTVNEDFQSATLKNLAYGFATIMTCSRFIQLVKTWSKPNFNAE